MITESMGRLFGEASPGRRNKEDVMNRVSVWHPKVPIAVGIAGMSFALMVISSVGSTARADDDAAKIVKAMSNYIGSQKSISLTFDTDIEVITPEIQKIQFASSGTVLMNRPDKLRAIARDRNGAGTKIAPPKSRTGCACRWWSSRRRTRARRWYGRGRTEPPGSGCRQ